MISLKADMYSKKFGDVNFSSTSACGKMIFCILGSGVLEFWYANGSFNGSDEIDLFLSEYEANKNEEGE